MSIKSLFENIANAIKNVYGTTDTLTPAEMPEAITNFNSIFQTKNLSAPISGQTTVEGCLSSLSSDLSELNSNLETEVITDDFTPTSYIDNLVCTKNNKVIQITFRLLSNVSDGTGLLNIPSAYAPKTVIWMHISTGKIRIRGGASLDCTYFGSTTQSNDNLTITYIC